MKIAVSSLITRPITENTHGGTERFTYVLVKELVRRGHDVHLYASSDSETPATLHHLVDSKTAISSPMNEKISLPYYLLYAQKIAREADQYDIIHNNFFHYYLLGAFQSYIKTPLIHTIHNAFYQNESWRTALQQFPKGDKELFVFVSSQAEKSATFSGESATIHHGIDTSEFPYQETAKDYFLWLGRMVPEKGADQAIGAIQQTEFSLILNTSAKANTKSLYYEKEVKHHLSERIHMLEKDSHSDKVMLYQEAKALLFPIMWEEPFGLVMLEAMSCGTPIIAYARGSVPEIVVDGETGFLINPSDEKKTGEYMIKATGQAGLVEAIKRISSLPESEYTAMRQNCRKRVEAHFSIQTMIEKYEELYERLVSR